MKRYEKFIKRITLGLFAVTMISLLISAMGALVETPVLAYFWFLALAGILASMLLSVLVAVVFVVSRGIIWYRRQILLWNGKCIDSWDGTGMPNA